MDRGETIILMRSDSLAEIDPYEQKLDEAGAISDIRGCRSPVGGAKAFVTGAQETNSAVRTSRDQVLPF